MSDHSFDCIIVGAGPAGLAAAVTAAEAGMRVAVIDENDLAGGQIWRSNRGTLHPNAARWFNQAQHAGVRFFEQTSVLGRSPSHDIEIVTNDHSRRLKTESIILATGGRELFLPFPGWTLPGVVGVGGLQALVKGGVDVQGKNVAVAGSGPLLPAVGVELQRRGAHLAVVSEQADLTQLLRFGLALLRHPGKLLQSLRIGAALRGVPKKFSSWPARAEGENQLESFVLADKVGSMSISCDLLACSFGLVPNTRLARLFGCTVDRRGIVVNEMQQTDVPGVYAAGECTGIGGVDVALVEGSIAGLAVAGLHDQARHHFRKRAAEHRFANALQRSFKLRHEVFELADDTTTVCRCEDVVWAELKNLESWRSAKLQTRVGMGPCQGRVCGAALSSLKDWSDASPRPPLHPVSLAALANLGPPVRSKHDNQPNSTDGGSSCLAK